VEEDKKPASPTVEPQVQFPRPVTTQSTNEFTTIQSPQTPPVDKTPDNKRPKFLIPVLLIMAVIILGVILYLFTQNKKKDLPEQQTAGTQESIFEKTHQVVFLEIVEALESNNPKELFDKFAPSMKEFFVTYDNFAEAFNKTPRVTKITIISDSELKVGDAWEIGKWAEGTVEITREETTEQQYVIRLVNENNQWWLFATIALTEAEKPKPDELVTSNVAIRIVSEIPEVVEFSALIESSGNKVVYVEEGTCENSCYLIAVKEDLPTHQVTFNRYKIRGETVGKVVIFRLDIAIGDYLPL